MMKTITFLVISLFTFAVLPASAQQHHQSVDLPPELDRVLRDYEVNWAGRNPDGLASLFTEDGFVLPSGRSPVRGTNAIAEEYRRAGGSLVLRALHYSVEQSLGYIVGAYRYGEATADVGKFVLVVRKDDSGKWLIAADIDNGNGN